MGPEFNEAFGTTPDQIASGTVPVATPPPPLSSAPRGFSLEDIAKTIFGPRSWDEMMRGNFFGPYQQPPGTDSVNAGNAPAGPPNIVSGPEPPRGPLDLSGNLPPAIANLIRPPELAGTLASAAAQAGRPFPGGGYGGGPQPGAVEPEPAQTIAPQAAAPQAQEGGSALEPPMGPLDPTKPTTYIGGQYYQGDHRVPGPSPADNQVKPAAAPDRLPSQREVPPAQGDQPPAAAPTAAPSGQQAPNLIQAIVDLFTKGPEALRQDLLGVSQQAQPSVDWMPGYGPSTGRYIQDPAIDQRYGNRIDPTTGRPIPGTSPAPGKTPAEDEKQQAEQRRQDLGQGGTYIVNDKGERVRVQTNPDGSVKTDTQGNPIPAADAQQGTGAAPGAAVTRGSYPALDTRLTNTHPVSLRRVNPGLQDTLAAGAQAFENANPGYKVRVMSGARGGPDAG
jgi:hypothetical protein